MQQCPSQQLECPLCGAWGNEAGLLTHWRENCCEITLNCSKCGAATTRAQAEQHDCLDTLLKLREEDKKEIDQLKKLREEDQKKIYQLKKRLDDFMKTYNQVKFSFFNLF
jgi:hypothetical protein